MRTSFTWVLGIAALISIAVLMACSSKYASSSNGLVVVSAQGNAVMDTFSLDLGNGHVTEINNVNGPPTNGVATVVVLDPAGAFAYVLVTQSSTVLGSATGVESFAVASDGKLGAGTTTGLKPVSFTPPGASVAESVPVAPSAMVIDSGGKFLFVADASTGDPSNIPVPGAISVLAIGSGGLTEVPGSPFPLATPVGGTTASASALAISPTVYPVAFAACSGNVPPTTENLYVTDSANYLVLNYSVSSSGALSLTMPAPMTPGVPTGTIPSGVTVDPCNRFVYVSNGQPNNSVSAYTICSVISLPKCPNGDFSLLPVSGSPFTAGNGTGPLGPLLMDAYGNFLYVLNTGQGAIAAYKVSTTTGGLTPLTTTPVVTNGFPSSIAIRNDDSWLFVTNTNQASLSEYAITPSSGALTPQPPVQTDNTPWGVAVK